MADENRIDRAWRGAFGSRAVTDWATAHFGLISRRKLLSLGISEDQIDRLVRSGWLHPVAAGVYVVGYQASVPGQREAIALAAAGPGAALSGPSAAGWRGMTEPWRGPVHLIVPASRGKPMPGVVRHVDRLGAGDVTTVRGLACVTPERAAMDLRGPRLRQGLQWLMRHDVAVEPLVERMRGRRGAVAFRVEAATLVPQLAHTMSELEARFVRLCARAGLPMPVVNGTLAGADLLDCTWPDRPLVVELDGRRWHAHRADEDHARDRRRILEGRLPFRYGWDDVARRGARTAAELRTALG